MITTNTVALPDPNDDGSRRADSNLGGEQRHDGNENGEQQATDSNHNGNTDADCDRCPHQHDCLFDDSFVPTCQPRVNQLALFESDATDEGGSEEYTDPTGRVYSVAEVNVARFEKYPAIQSWFVEHRTTFSWLDSAFLELASIASGAEVSGNTLIYHLRYRGICDGRGRRQRRRVRVSNSVTPLLARVLGRLHPDESDKLRTNPCIWDVPALQPLLDDLAGIIEEQ